MSPASSAETFPLRATRPWRWLLRLIGVRPGAAEVELTPDDRFLARFGPFTVETSIANISGYRLTGPYRFWRAIGPRGSGADRGFTFGTSPHGGVCVCFREWPPARYVRGGKLESLTVTVDNVDGLARALEARGIEGEDERRA
ncbi:MAG: hypothetical protein K5924_04620 [Chloroflexi bacterium]|nr:hypothetical protein [Chloroflexota bacterium]